MKKNEEGIKMM